MGVDYRGPGRGHQEATGTVWVRDTGAWLGQRQQSRGFLPQLLVAVRGHLECGEGEIDKAPRVN